jgi:hypothetical protein
MSIVPSLICLKRRRGHTRIAALCYKNEDEPRYTCRWQEQHTHAIWYLLSDAAPRRPIHQPL